MTKLRRICLAFVRWRERRAWAAMMRWQRIAWRVHGIKGATRRQATIKPDGSIESLSVTHVPDKRDGYFLRPGWRKAEPPTGPSVENIRKASDA